MEGELHAVFEGAFADLVQVSREDPGVRWTEIFGSQPRIEVRLQRRNAEVRAELRVGGVALERGLQLRGIEVLSAAGYRRDADARFVEKLGAYNPVVEPKTFEIERSRYEYWRSKGAQPSATLVKLLKKYPPKAAAAS